MNVEQVAPPLVETDQWRSRARGSPGLVLVLLLLVALAACLVSLFLGHGRLSDLSLRETFLQLRAARTAVAFLAGASLAVGGVLVQGLFRNPLACPSILGTTAGASLGGQSALLVFQFVLSGTTLSWVPADTALPLGCVAGALVALSLLLVLGRFQGDLVVLLLTGFLLSSLFVSVGSFLVSAAQDSWELGRAIVTFTLGSVAGAGPRQILLALPLFAFGLIAAVFWSSPLDLMLSGEDEAESLGVDVKSVRFWVVVWTGLLTAGAVSVGGNVGFVGLIAPHLLRPILGDAHRRLIPAAALVGGAFLVVCDGIARSIVPQGELPLGVVTGIIGAPLFLMQLSRIRQKEGRLVD